MAENLLTSGADILEAAPPRAQTAAVARAAAGAHASAEIASLAGVIAFVCTYVATDWLSLPRLFYLPLENRVILATQAAGAAMGYLGACLWASAVGGIAFACVRRWGRALGARSERALSVLAAVAFVASLVYFLRVEWP